MGIPASCGVVAEAAHPSPRGLPIATLPAPHAKHTNSPGFVVPSPLPECFELKKNRRTLLTIDRAAPVGKRRDLILIILICES